jgi:hypothetical protein
LGAVARDQPGLLEPLEVGPHPVGMKSEPVGELGGPRRLSVLGEQREQPGSGRLRQRVIRARDSGEINHRRKFCTAAL